MPLYGSLHACTGGKLMFLPRSEEDLLVLQDYLVRKKGLSGSVGLIRLSWAGTEDARNMKDPRGFCHTVQGRDVIYCSRALEDTVREVRVGILIHEIGHIILNAFDDDESEVDVDAWVTMILPKGCYGYMKKYTYMNSLVEEEVVAKAIQAVSPKFLFVLDNLK